MLFNHATYGESQPPAPERKLIDDVVKRVRLWRDVEPFYPDQRSTLFEFADTLLALSRDQPEIAGVIAHSGGCAAAAWALSQKPGWPVRRMVFVAPFGSPARYMTLFQRALGLSDAAMRHFRESTERQFNFRWADMEVAEIADRLKTPPLLVVHDRDDRETAWQDGADIASRWPLAELHTTTGLGHVRILRDSAVVELAVRFLAMQPAPAEKHVLKRLNPH